MYDFPVRYRLMAARLRSTVVKGADTSCIIWNIDIGVGLQIRKLYYIVYTVLLCNRELAVESDLTFRAVYMCCISDC